MTPGESLPPTIFCFSSKGVGQFLMLSNWQVGHMFTLVSQPGGLDRTQVSATDGNDLQQDGDFHKALR